MAASSSQDNEWIVVERDSTRRFERYNKIIGGGSAKTVYKGFDQLFGTEIAWSKIKVSPGTEETKENLVKLCAEPQLLMLLDHENITKCYHYWIDEYNNVVNMITEYCCSGNLAKYCKTHQRNLVGNTAIKNLCRQILKALHYLHTHDPPITHRDINCSNIFVNGNTGTVKLGDFGQAKVFRLGSKPVFVTDIFFFVGIVAHTVIAFGDCDPQLKQMLRKCRVPPPDGPTAMDLLVNDQFLAVDIDVAESSNAGSSNAAGILNMKERVRDQVDKLLMPPKEVVKEIEIQNRKLKLQGIMSDYLSNSIILKLIIDLDDRFRTIVFEFILGFDTIRDMMGNVNEELNIFSADEVAVVSDIMVQIVTELQDEPSIAGEDWYLQELFSEENSGVETSNDAQDRKSTHSNRSQYNQDTERGRSDDDNRRRGNNKLSSWLCCKKF